MKRYFFFLSLLFTAALVQAQERLSLEAAIAKGLSNNFEVNITKLSLDAAKLNNNWGQAGRYPTINLIVNNNNNIVQRKPANPFAVAGRNISDNINGQLDVQFILFDGLAVNIRKERLTQLEELSAGNATLVMENAVQQMILGYYTVLVEKERLKVLQTNLAFSKERYGYVKLRKELGSAITFDVLQEQNNYLTDSANVLRQEINYKYAVRNLNELINEDLNKQYTFTDSLYFDQQTYSFDDLRAKMASTNTNLRNQFTNQELLRNAKAQQRALQAPTVSLNLGATGSLDRLNAQFRPISGGEVEKNTIGFVNDDTSQPVIQTRFRPEYQTQTGDSYGVYGNISIRWTLFNGTQIKRAIKTAEIQEKIGAMSTDQLKLSLENDLAANFDVYILRMQLVKISETKYKAAELNLQLANERYKNGALSAIDLRIVQENFRNAALENYTAIFEALQTQTELVRLTGGLLAENQKL
ncbi:MAG: TolC family protein [Flammeovirgaceae bacterium]|nr:TolC family protein [Flammeovirgaceae bacterium]